MKNNSIVVYNQNCHRSINKNISVEDKIKLSAKEIKSTYGLPLVLMFQEIIAGKNQKFLNLLRTLFTQYELITPVGFDYFEHYKSIMSVTLVRRDALSGYSVIELDSELPNRICYSVANLNGSWYRLINAHVVQIQNFKYQADWYIAERMRLHSQQWNLLKSDLHKNKDADVIFAGDMQEDISAGNLTKIIEDGYLVPGSSGAGIQTVNNNFFNVDSCIDHVILSPSANAALGPKDMIIDNSNVGTLSDHALVCAKCS